MRSYLKGIFGFAMSNRNINIYPEYPNRDRQYDEALILHLKATWQQGGLTCNQVANALGRGCVKDYVDSIRDALAGFALLNATTVEWFPNVRVSD